MFFRLMALVILPGLLAGCGTPSLNLPQQFWNALYQEESNRNTVQQAVRKLHSICEKTTPEPNKKPLCDGARDAYDQASGEWNAFFTALQGIVLSNRQIADWPNATITKKNGTKVEIRGFDKALQQAADDTDAFLDAYNKIVCFPDKCKPCPPGTICIQTVADYLGPLQWLFPIGSLITAQSQANADERKGFASVISKIMWPAWECVGADKPCASP